MIFIFNAGIQNAKTATFQKAGRAISQSRQVFFLNKKDTGSPAQGWNYKQDAELNIEKPKKQTKKFFGGTD